MRASISKTVVIHVDLTQEDFDRIKKEWSEYNEGECEDEVIPAGISQLIETICQGHYHA